MFFKAGNRLIALQVAILASCLGIGFAAADGTTDEALVDAFLAHVADLETVDADKLEQVNRIVAEWRSDSPADALTESMIAIYDGYAAAIEASDGTESSDAASLLAPFADSPDSYLAADATFYLARTLMNHEKFEDALPLLEKVLGPLSDYTVHVGPARFYQGVAWAGLLQYDKAVASLKDFLQSYPDAPERLRVAAWRQVQQLQSIQEGQMEDIYQRMDYSRRRLAQVKSGEQTQEQQDRIVRMLNRLIKEQEKKEASSKSQNQKQQNKQQQQQQQANQKRQPSKSQTGGQSSNPNGEVVKKSYNDGPASPWSRLRDRSRDPANNAIKDKLPARYRDIVERYYEAANGNSGK